MVKVMPKLRVRDLMTDSVVAVGIHEDLAVLRDLMTEHNVRHIPVLDLDGELVGLVSHRDLLRHSVIEQEDVPLHIEHAVLEKVKVWEIMISNVETVDPDMDLSEAARLMLENKYGCVPVVEGRRLLGILTESDFVRYQANP